MSRSLRMALVVLLAGALPAAGDWVGQRLCATGLPRDGEFGSAVAVGEDGTIAVGDYRHDVVYRFRRNGADCQQLAPIRGTNGEWFGFAVAIDQGILLVGAPKAGGTGAAYRIDLDDSSLARQPLTVSPAQRGDEIGSSVALAGESVAIGARGADQRRGRVYVGSLASLTAVPQPEGLAERAELGQSVALSDKWLVMGAPSPFRGSDSPGAAYVLNVSDEGSPAVALTLPTGLEPEAAFGYAVAVDGDRVLIGAPLAAGTDAGAVYRYQLTNGRNPTLLRAGESGDQLGVSVALDGGTAVIGARYANGTRGAAYLMGFSSGSPQTLQPREPVPGGAQFGFAVAIRSGIVVVGAFREGGTGAAYDFAPAIRLELSSEKVLESSGSVTVTVRADQPVPRDVTVQISTIDGTANGTAEEGDDGDYIALERRAVTIPAGATTLPAPLEIDLNPDDACEPKETFTVALFDPPGSEKAVQEETVTIKDDDPGDLLLEPAPLRTSEDGSPVELHVVLTCQPFEPVTVSLEALPSSVAGISLEPLTFTYKDWNVPQAVNVSGSDNADCGPAVEPYEIRATTSSEDSRYAGVSRSTLAENADDELACLSARMDVCVEGDGTAIYTIFISKAGPESPIAPALLVDRLPDEVSVVTASANRGTATADPLAGSVQWHGPVPPGIDTVTVTIVGAFDVLPPPDAKNRAHVTYARDSRGTLQSVATAEGVAVCPPDPEP